MGRGPQAGRCGGLALRAGAAAVAVVIGLLVVAAATVVGWNEGWLDRLVTPPPLIRAALVGGSVALAAALLARSPASRDRARTTCPV